MFGTYHLIWLAIIIVIIVVVLVILCHFKVRLDRVVLVCFIYACVSEIVKVLVSVEMLPTADGGVTPYLPTENVPLHLCSIQTIFIAILCFTKKDSRIHKILLPFMFVTCIVGAACAVAMPTCFSDAIPYEEAFLHIRPYQYFLHHAMLIILGFYIPLSGGLRGIRARDIGYSIALLALCAYMGLVVNSLFANITYTNIYDEEGNLIGSERVVNSITNFFFVFGFPEGVPIFQYDDKSGWLIYLLFLTALAAVLVTIFELPFVLYYRKHKPVDEAASGSELALVGEGANAPNQEATTIVNINVQNPETENKAYLFTSEENKDYIFKADAATRALLTKKLEEEQEKGVTPLVDILTSLTTTAKLPEGYNSVTSTDPLYNGYTLVYVDESVCLYYLVNKSKKSIDIVLVNRLSD
ncbi:MAG: YwaF family protein [Coprobacillus sp.]|nr:YwaF family protein [Coprobacillus sp.]